MPAGSGHHGSCEVIDRARLDGRRRLCVPARERRDPLRGHGPINLDIGDHRHLEPDIAVKRVEDLDASESVPVLLVEVLSPSTWRHDTHRKREVYRELGVPSFWLVDPVESIVTVLDLVDGDYVETARIDPGDVVEVARPFPVRIAPGEWTPLD